MGIAKRAAILSIRLYQRYISPMLGDNCRFYPSCSEYAAQAIGKHGFIVGSMLSVVRIAKCGPWHPGGVDLVPDEVRFDGIRKIFRRKGK